MHYLPDVGSFWRVPLNKIKIVKIKGEWSKFTQNDLFYKESVDEINHISIETELSVELNFGIISICLNRSIT